MVLSQIELEDLLQRLREQQTESSVVEAKADLPLETEGDRAFFIRHVAALANNVEPSYLIIGIEDRTWSPIGLSENSSLHDSDQTQTRMNQILANRLDPNVSVSVRYRTYEVSGVVLGLVAVEGTRAPYITAIEDQQYGGDRTRGEPSYIYRGAIYIRRGANSVIANRQSEILEIVNRVQQTAISNGQPDDFLLACNYLDVESENFGRHPLSGHLMEIRVHRTAKSPGGDQEHVPAESWVSFVLYPVDRGCDIHTRALKAKLKPDQRIGREGKWYHAVPRPLSEMFRRPQATRREFRGRWQLPLSQNTEVITHFIRIRSSGHIEVGGTYPLFYQRNGVRFFAFVTLIGYLWQMIYLSKAIYRDADFYGEIAVLLNLVGTNGTRLAEFADGWPSPFTSDYGILRSSGQEICYDPNIQIEQRLLLADASDGEIETMVHEIAADLGAYYDQERPRCFDCRTGEFPSRDYVRANYR